jgi:hypothetical protein
MRREMGSGEEGHGAREEVRATPDVVMHETVAVLLVSELLERVGPEDVAHKAVRRRLTEAVDLFDPISTHQFCCP